jgi:hypothetical protein
MRVQKKKWRRYRFFTKSVDDPRPLIFNPKFPWWCSGYTGDFTRAVIVAYLPVNEPLERYWDDASNIEYTDHPTITFTDRFPRPDDFVEENK